MKAQYAILRFAKYKGPTVSRIEAHNERTKETYASNPDIKVELSKHNFHPVVHDGKYRDISNRIIREVGCRVRKDGVTAVEALITASPEFFEKKSRKEAKEFFKLMKTFMEKQHILTHTQQKGPPHFLGETAPLLFICIWVNNCRVLRSNRQPSS